MRRLRKELWPYCVAIGVVSDSDKCIEIETWLEENLGCITDQWNVVYLYTNKTDFYFREAQDVTMFALKWSR
jgi:hypothetical protein